MNTSHAPTHGGIPRRHFISGLAAAGAAFAIPSRLLGEPSVTSPASAPPLQGHFHPKGKAPSEFTIDLLRKAKSALPFADKRDFE